jgi:hypothetical protein
MWKQVEVKAEGEWWDAAIVEEKGSLVRVHFIGVSCVFLPCAISIISEFARRGAKKIHITGRIFLIRNKVGTKHRGMC